MVLGQIRLSDFNRRVETQLALSGNPLVSGSPLFIGGLLDKTNDYLKQMK